MLVLSEADFPVGKRRFLLDLCVQCTAQVGPVFCTLWHALSPRNSGSHLAPCRAQVLSRGGCLRVVRISRTLSYARLATLVRTCILCVEVRLH